jgi:hypothetical protein
MLIVIEITTGKLESVLAEITYKYRSLICTIINSQFLLASSFGLKYLKEMHSNYFQNFYDYWTKFHMRYVTKKAE